MKIIFFGAGNFADDVWKQMSERPYLYIDDYFGTADNNSDLWGTVFHGKPVIAPFEINKNKIDLVVVTSIYEDSIRKQLNELGIESQQIYSYKDYLRKCYASWIYRKQYGGVKRFQKCETSVINRIVVYTAITGNYDKLQEPLFVSDNVTYVCITNNRDIKSNVWNIEYIKNDSLDNVHLARYIKMNPHLFFSDYELSVWVDGKYQIMNDLRTYVASYQNKSSILCFPHPQRECICDEVAECISANRGNKKDMILQVADYLREGYPLNNGLFETGCMVRKHNDKKVQVLMRLWGDELLKYSIRDQLSFPYVCWKNKYIPDICDLDVNRNHWLLQRKIHS